MNRNAPVFIRQKALFFLVLRFFILRLVLVVKVIFGQVGTAGHIGLGLAELEVV